MKTSVILNILGFCFAIGNSVASSDDITPRTLAYPDLTGIGPSGAQYTWSTVTDAGLTVESFEQSLTESLSITRRYLQYLPKNFDASKSYPIVVLLHGATVDAEWSREFDKTKDIERLADEHDFVVIYANAIPSQFPNENDDPFLANGGVWINNNFGGLQTDLQYLIMIRDDLNYKGIKVRDGEIFLAGISNGAQLALHASELLAPYIRATFAGVPVPVRLDAKKLDMSVMFYYSKNDPIIAPIPIIIDHEQSMNTLGKLWAKAIGVNKKSLRYKRFKPMPNLIHEGADYTGDSEVISQTKNSRLEQIVYRSSRSNNQVHIIRSRNAGHAIPHPELVTQDYLVEGSNGIRNQDINGIEVMTNFFIQYMYQ